MFSAGAFIRQDADASYLPFIKRDVLGATDISIDLVRDAMPDTAQLKRIFDSGQSWSMFEGRDSYVMSLAPPALGGEAVCIAEFDREVTRSTVHCADLFWSSEKGLRTVTNPVRYPIDQILLMHALAQRGGAVLHAAGAIVGKEGYIFPGRSGAGKSTLSRQFIGRQDAELLSDDRIIAKKSDGRFSIFGTPWPGEAGIAVNKSAALSGIFFLCQGTTNKIAEITSGKAVEKLLPVVSIPWYDGDLVSGMLAFCGELVSTVPVYELHFRPDGDVANLLAEFADHA